jgi:hypothetical protein
MVSAYSKQAWTRYYSGPDVRTHNRVDGPDERAEHKSEEQ